MTMKITNSGCVPVKHVPQRTCVACREVKAKRELIRLVRTPDGNIEIDSNGKKAGRGTYLCRTRGCWEKGLKRNQLEQALHSTLTQDGLEQLMKQAEELRKGAD